MGRVTGPSARMMLEWARVEFERTRNPLCAWEAIGWAREARVAIPEWVNDYLYTVADHVFDLCKHPRKVRAGLLMKALGFGQAGRGRKLDAFDALVPRWSELAGALRIRREAGESYAAAREAVALSHGVSESVIDRACTRARRDPSSRR